MKFLNTRLKKILFWISITVIAIVVLVIAFISPLTKWAIEKYDVKYTGREITLDLAYVNPFTGHIYLKNLELHEANSDTIFFSTKGLSVNFEMLKMLKKTYEISEITLNKPYIRIVQNKKSFNFDDIVKTLSPKDTLPKPEEENKEPVHFNFFNAKIKDGEFHYIEQSVPIHYFITEVNIETNGKRWDADTMGFRYDFNSGPGKGGNLKGAFDMDMASLDFKLVAAISKFDLSPLEQYVKDIANYGRVRGFLDASLEAEGNFKNSQNLVARGPLAISDFHIGRSLAEDFFAFKKAAVDIVELSPSRKKYIFDSIFVLEPYFKYERYDHLDNLQDMFGEKGEEVKKSQSTGKTNILFEIGGYVEALAKNFFRSDYKVKRLAVYNADIRYNDYALNEKFAAAVTPLTLIADSIERGDKWVKLKLNTGLKPYGKFDLALAINPRDSSDFTLDYHLHRISMAMFNPYFVTFTSFPVDRGILEFKGSARVQNGVISCNNHLVIVDPRVNNRQKRNGARWLPLRVFMFLVRERGNVIDYEIPIRGDLKDPKFKFKDVIFDVLTNIFVKPVTTPYRIQVRNTENEIEKTLTLKWVMREARMNDPQEKFTRKLADFLEDHPNETIRISPEQYTEREKEYILFFEAKKKYYLSVNRMKASALSERDSTNIERLAVKDSSFLTYLDTKGGKDLHTVQDKCRQVVSDAEVARKLEQLNRQRRKFFMSFFEPEISKRIKFMAIKDTVPFNGFSQYRISFSSSMPEDLTEAYEKINELDDNNPRNRFKEVRKKNKRLLDAK